ncbi:MAG: allophanate hydrolase subunit 1 [Mycobacterium sp.]|jgi:KipI family sensor histidine kinase inhibitor|nr:allophanate hydrolase subunit 1 [Mycobacterium sp.]MCX6479096.1 allophanate hydrolase subunit 1 [Mycobacterium sp.]
MASPIRPAVMDYGDRALLLECASGDDVLALTDAVRDAKLPGVIDVVPAARTVLVTLGDPALQATTRSRLAGIEVLAPEARAAGHGPRVVIDVVYDGADLAVVAGHLGMAVAEVVDAHTRTPWRVGFCGFAPGFAYLIDGDPRLDVPRRAEPRSRVPAGSVALAGAFSGVYPRDSPGGWQLIGRTDAVLWDINRPQPALLTPGTWVQFRARAAR